MFGGLQVKLIGPPRAIADAQSWLSTVHESRVIMNIPAALVPAVIGSKGANFVRIQKDHGVEIDTKAIGESGDLAMTVWGVEPAALEAARPSVPEAERQRLEAIYARFRGDREGSGGGAAAAVDRGKGKLVTWA